VYTCLPTTILSILMWLALTPHMGWMIVLATEKHPAINVKTFLWFIPAVMLIIMYDRLKYNDAIIQILFKISVEENFGGLGN